MSDAAKAPQAGAVRAPLALPADAAQQEAVLRRLLDEGLSGQPFSLDDAQRETLCRYLVLLREADRHINLTAVTDDAGMVCRHLLDSLALLPLCPADARDVYKRQLTGSRDKGVFPMQAVPLTRNNDFRRLYKRGKSLVDRNIVVYYAKNRLGANRVGFTVGKKVGGAVTRNRAKRLMRESFRLLEPGLAQGFDFVLVSRSRLPHLKRQAVDASLSRLLGSAGLLHKGESCLLYTSRCV